jgi:hypothetical protein
VFPTATLFIQEGFWCSRKLLFPFRKVSGVPESYFSRSGRFLMFQKADFSVQESFWCSRKLLFSFRKVSGVPES